MIKEAIKKIKENNNISYKEILLRANLPESDRTALGAYMLSNRSYPIEKIDKILEAFGVEIIVKNNNKYVMEIIELPIKSNDPKDIDVIRQYIKMGIKILGVSDVNLFLSCELPNGWYLKEQNQYWKYLFDNKARHRASIYFKNEIHEKESFINFNKAFLLDLREGDFNEYGYCVLNRNTNEIIFDGGTDDKNSSNQSKNKCIEFLKQNFRDFDDINAYWN